MSGQKILTFTRLAIAHAQAQLDGNIPARAIAEHLWGKNDPATIVLKATVSSGSTTDPNWAAALVAQQTASAEFVEALRPRTILGKMAGMRRVPNNVRVPRATAGAQVSWVGQGRVIPVSAMALDAVALEILKVAGIVVTTTELAKFSDPSAEEIIQEDLLAAVAAWCDRSFIDPSIAEAPGVAPASITFGAPSVASTGSTPSAVRADLRALFKLAADLGIVFESPYLVTDRRTAINLSLMDDAAGAAFAGVTVNGGILAGVPLITTGSVPTTFDSSSPPVSTSSIALVDAAEVLVADENGAEIDMSGQATLEMNSTPDSPVTASTVQISMWQNNLMAWRVTRAINWKARRPGAAALLTGVSY